MWTLAPDNDLLLSNCPRLKQNKWWKKKDFLSCVTTANTLIQVGRWRRTPTKNYFMGLTKLAGADISKPRWNNKSVIAASPLFPLGVGPVLSALCLSASQRCQSLPELDSILSPPPHFMERKFLKGWARQIATDPTLPSSVVSFLRKVNSNDRWDYLPPSPLASSTTGEHTLHCLPLPHQCTCLP